MKRITLRTLDRLALLSLCASAFLPSACTFYYAGARDQDNKETFVSMQTVGIGVFGGKIDPSATSGRYRSRSQEDYELTFGNSNEGQEAKAKDAAGIIALALKAYAAINGAPGL